MEPSGHRVLTWLDRPPTVHLREFLTADSRKKEIAGGGGGANTHPASWTAAADPFNGLIEALITSVFAMVMIERNDGARRPPSYLLNAIISCRRNCAFGFAERRALSWYLPLLHVP